MPESQQETAERYSLKQFTERSLESTRKDWRKVAGDDEFTTEYGFVFEWASCHINYDDSQSDSLAYGLFLAKSSKASAIVEVIQRQQARKGLTKMLKLWISPEFWNAEANRQEIAAIMITAIQGTFHLSKQNQSKTVKIYGRTEQMLSILHTVHAMFSEMITKGELSHITVNMANRWLVFNLEDTKRAK